MSEFLKRIERERVAAAEAAVIASIPKSMRDAFDQAQREHEAKGGCPSCGHMVFACHYSHCSIVDLY